MIADASRKPAARIVRIGPHALGLAAMLLLATAAPVAGKGPFDSGRLWRISKAGVADSFVLGTIHVADPRVAVIARPIASALAQSRILAVELVPEAGDARTFELEELEDGKRLEPLIGAEAFGRLRDKLGAQGMPAGAIERLKPWAAMLKIARSAPGIEQSSLDEQLFVAARVRRLQVLPLELLEEQIAAFDTIPLETQVAMLSHALEHRDALAANVEPTIAAWLAGDLAALARISDRSYAQFPGMAYHYGRLIQHIIRNRTALMHHRLFMPLRNGRVFVAIGALHLHGDLGLLALLEADGYRVTKVW
jgi:uncharacterized protein YbaP (TraB family)